MSDTSTIQDLPALLEPVTRTEPTAALLLDGLPELAVLPQELRTRITTVLDGLHTQIAGLEQALAAHSSDLAGAHGEHQDDITRIGQVLLREANRRDWCTDYDTIVAALNTHLHRSLPVREHEHTFEIEVTITLAAITAVDEGTAREQARRVARDLERFVDDLDAVKTTTWQHSNDFDHSL